MSGRRRTIYTTAYVGDVDVEVDLSEVIEGMTDDELAEYGLYRAPAAERKGSSGSQYEHDLCSPALAEHKWAVSKSRAEPVAS